MSIKAPAFSVVVSILFLPTSSWSFIAVSDQNCRRNTIPPASTGYPSACWERRATLDDDSSVSSVPLSDENDLRFAGVGRLYTTAETAPMKQIDAESTNQTLMEPLPRNGHFGVIDRLEASRVVVVGLGGVGSWAAEALCRSGVGHITLIDLDDICISNTNRQLHALATSVGQMKIDAMQSRLKNINPNCEVTLIHDFVSKENADEIWKSIEELSPKAVTACLDAIDGSDAKTAWIAACARRKVPIVTCGGSAGRTDPTKFICDDLTRAIEDPLLSSCRKNLRKYYGFQEGVSPGSKARDPSSGKLRKKLPRKWKIQAVYSRESPRAVSRESSSMRRCDGALGTACFVTGTSGFIAASRVVEMIANDKLAVPKQFRNNKLRTKTWGR
jgi:tRNA A37 threonylcarbamoyladenosine dehydratase